MRETNHAMTDRVRKGAVLTNDEYAEVRRLRGLRMGWDAVARAIGRSTPAVRAACDPTWWRAA
jgi:hypothetical protein